MRLHFIRSPKPRSVVLEELYAILGRRGHEVTESIPDGAVQDLDAVPEHDLYILKARTKLSVSVAGILHQRGARILNPYPSCAMLLDKVVVTAALRRAGIPTPRSWAVADVSLLGDMAERLPLIVKPFDGIHSQGVRVVRHPAELENVRIEGPVLVQEFIQGCDARLKIHGVGECVFATWKPFSLGGRHEQGQPRPIGDEVRDIALRCGRLFGLGLYGLDVLIGTEGPVVVDVNSIPGYKGVPGIAPILADYIEAYARGSALEVAVNGPTLQASSNVATGVPA
jgi:ribosomal protein S6--L-glutamate ligase